MDLERDCLNLYILPKLKEYYNPKGYNIQLIDLRWGVSTEDKNDEKSKEQAILNTCLNVIDNCRPFFIGFIGNRYGWVPPRETLKPFTLGNFSEELYDGDLSVTQLEIEYGIIQKELYSTSLLFMRSSDSYQNLNEEDTKLYIDEDELNKGLLSQRNQYLRSRFVNAGYDNHIIEYSIPISYQHISECNDFINLVFSELISLIDDNLTNKEGEKKLEDWLTHLLLNDYIQNDKFILETLNAINEKGDVLLYGASNSGKTSFSLYLKVLLGHLNPDAFIFHYSPQLHGNYSLLQLLRQWRLSISESYIEEELDTTEAVWKSFVSIVDNTERHVVVIIDSFDRIEEMMKNNFMLIHPTNLHFILTSASRLKKWEIFKKLQGYTLPLLDNKSAQILIDNICTEYNKNLPTKVKQAILDTRVNDEGLYYAADLKRILTVLLNFSKNDFTEIRNATESPEDNIVNYLLKTIFSFPKDIKEQSEFLISKMNNEYSFDDMLPFYLIALSKVGLNESELSSCLKKRFNLITFSLIKHIISPYLAPKNDSGRWLFADKNISEALTQTISENQKHEFYRILAKGLNTNLEIYYAINSESSNTIIAAINKYREIDDDCVKSLIHNNIFQSYLEGNSVIKILTNSREEFVCTNIEHILDIVTFTFPREYIIGHGVINKFDYFTDLIHLFETLTDGNCGGNSNKCYYLGVSYMGAAQAISKFTLHKSDKIRGLSLYEKSINYFELCKDDSIKSHIEYCRREILDIQSSM